jgi:hypothetical protein
MPKMGQITTTGVKDEISGYRFRSMRRPNG